MNTIWIVPIEPIDSRYTQQWYDNIPVLARQAAGNRFQVMTIDGQQIKSGTSTGGFLDWGATNVYKASQTEAIGRLFSGGAVQAGDRFLITDAWNFVITAIRYMSDLMQIPVEIHGIWHAGAYDPTDILGLQMQKPWPWHTERGWFYACDYNYYATNFHRDMFLRNLNIPESDHSRAVRSGQPHELIVAGLVARRGNNKWRQVIWPHRYNADKQPDIAEDLVGRIAANLVITQKMTLTKDQYYDQLSQSLVTLSTSLHENLGISQMEGCLTGSLPCVPDRASYSEMYLPCFKYPTEWTSSWDNYLKHRDQLVAFVNNLVENYQNYQTELAQQCDILVQNYLNCDIMMKGLTR
jgi:hypothetical protein